jgi:hypothetical protein
MHGNTKVKHLIVASCWFFYLHTNKLSSIPPQIITSTTCGTTDSSNTWQPSFTPILRNSSTHPDCTFKICHLFAVWVIVSSNDQTFSRPLLRCIGRTPSSPVHWPWLSRASSLHGCPSAFCTHSRPAVLQILYQVPPPAWGRTVCCLLPRMWSYKPERQNTDGAATETP